MRYTINLTFFYFLLAITIFPFLSFTSGAAYAEETDLNQVKRGSLLLKTEDSTRDQFAPILKTDVDINITGLIARVSLKQTFKNHQEIWVEGIYVFPLPEKAAVDKMRINVGGRIIEAQIKERSEAKKMYTEALKKGKKTALVEQERENLFTNSIANIAPGETIIIEIEYQQVLDYEQGEFRLRFPMAVTPRYIPGEPVLVEEKIEHFDNHGWSANSAQVKDASRITPPVWQGEGKLNPVSLQITLDSGFQLSHLESLYHDIQSQLDAKNRTIIDLQDEQVASDRDFVLVWQPESGQEPKAALFSEEKDGEFYHLLMVLPPKTISSDARMSREVIFIIDTSGSMGGTSIKQAKDSLTLALTRLQPNDGFNIISFNSVTDTLFSSARNASKNNIRLAQRYVSSLAAGGGTEMKTALQIALLNQQSDKAIRQVIFLTDGSVGNEAALFQFIKKNVGESRLFTVGIGSAPNSHFMRKAAQFGRGAFVYIGDLSEIKPKMAELFNKLETAAMTHVKINFDGNHNETYPQRLPDLYHGEPLIITTKTRMANQNIIVQGERQNQQWRSSLSLSQVNQNSGIATLWAREKVSSLTDRIWEGESEQTIKPKIIDVALKHHLVSKYTSLIAVDITPSRPAQEGIESQAVPVNLPQGQIRQKIFGSHAQTASGASLKIIVGLFLFMVALLMIRSKMAEVRHED